MTLSLYESDGRSFCSLLPLASSYFKIFNSKTSNYANATLLMHLQYSYYDMVKHPALPLIDQYFAAFNEEKGEKSIHLALRHLVDSNFVFENMREHYLLQPAFRALFKKFNLSNNKKKGSGYKHAPIDLDESLEPTPLESRLLRIKERFETSLESMKNGTYYYYEHNSSTNVYLRESKLLLYNDAALANFTTQMKARKTNLIDNLKLLRLKMSASIEYVVPEEFLEQLELPQQLQ